MCAEAVRKKPQLFEFVPDKYKVLEMKEAMRISPVSFYLIPDHLTLTNPKNLSH